MPEPRVPPLMLLPQVFSQETVPQMEGLWHELGGEMGHSHGVVEVE